MVDKMNRFCSFLVSVHSIIYFLVGIMIGLASHFVDGTILTIQHTDFLNNISLPIFFYTLLLGLFCSIFYQEKYNNFQFRKDYFNGRRIGPHLGVPSEDNAFYSVMKDASLNDIRKACGYIYAFSKPVVLIIIGLTVISLLIFLRSRA